MANRSAYHKQYREDNAARLSKYAKEKYEEDREDRLTYQRDYDILHREERMAKRQILEPGELIAGIHKCIHKYSEKWHILCDCYRDLLDWSVVDPVFMELYKAWKESGYNKFLRPVVMRDVKKNGFIKGNLHWDIKKNFSWWNEDKELYAQVEKETEVAQRVKNKSTKEWKKKVQEDYNKMKQKSKEKHK